MAEYIKWIRSRVGHDPIFLNAAGGIVINQNGEVLLERRGDMKKESWGLPGGIMELGEVAHETVIREIFEETGLKVEVLRFLGVYTSRGFVKYDNGDQCQMVTQVFVCRAVAGESRPDGLETIELKYFKKEDRPTLFREHIEQALVDFENRKYCNSRQCGREGRST